MLGLIGKKLGMSQIFDEKGEVVPVTIVEAGPCGIVDIKTQEKCGYKALQLGFVEAKNAKNFAKAQKVNFEKKGLPYYKNLCEFRVEDVAEYKIGQRLTVESFKVGDVVNVSGVTKGRGFQGVIKRWGLHGGPAAHGSDFHRGTGSIGMRTWPGRVIKGKKMPGQYGNENVTELNLRIVQVDAENNLLFISGAIPGTRNGIVFIHNKTKGYETRPELKGKGTDAPKQEQESSEAKTPADAGEKTKE